ncbi:pyrroline-5-carboxylate reductase [Neobacillus bataviensis]|uniref:Pyrroline-5-carboxylate reductase n=1 Tax=Neobacillus bataviensis TaxID=220685 RepID=A0A561DSD3_9BACI|nr:MULTISPECIES: pyrroline-5-carboxylate reductase [Bacillaceae]PFO03829.1 pyrroline-5-carboxylate reductase [Bacillus sp. AFS076308]PGV51206.1 pyrroline-5-carboxylate reductase [Bacillus sp. AFS037270]TWE06282.1 pyrroline-5-carboxylate reductase [Neobacillus bataviensis]
MKKIAIIGAGSMAEALISGIIENELIDKKHIWVTNHGNKNRLQLLEERYGISSTYELNTLFEGADIVMLAMKPKDADSAVDKIREYLTEDMLIVSVLAGVSMSTIETLARKPLSIARSMPNTSAAVGKSATAIAVNERVTTEQLETIKSLFETVGLAKLVEEEQLDAVTGLSGSGPAYIYYLIEAMENSADEIGLDKQIAQELIVQTLIGAAEMVKNSSKSPEQLRREVTSPGGTTEAGIHVLEEYGVQQAFISCIKAATEQSKKMGKALSSELNVGKSL